MPTARWARLFRRYLERVKVPEGALRQIDPLIRQLALYRDLIDHWAATTCISSNSTVRCARSASPAWPRLLERRRTQARFRDPHRSRDSFDFTFK